MARERGATLRMAPLAADGVLSADAVLDRITERTRWVAVTAASNALGSVPDLPRIVAAARGVGARVYVDGVQAVAHRPVDLAALGCDAFVTSPYKWYGPHCGVLVLRADLARGLRVAEQVPSAGEELPGRLELGTTNFEAVLGAGMAAAVLRGWDRAELRAREAGLAELLITGLREVPGVRLLGPDETADRVPVVAFQVGDRPAAEVAATLAARGASVWDGTFYAAAALRAVGAAEGAVRAGIAAYTRESDIEALVAALTHRSRP